MHPSRALPLAVAIALSGAVTLACQSSQSTSGTLARSALSPDEEAAIEVLYEYQDAHRQRDLARLARVWSMDPFQRVLMGRLFTDAASMPVSVQPLELRRSASDLVVDFAGVISRLRAPPAQGVGLGWELTLEGRRPRHN